MTAPEGMTPDKIAEASAREIAAGRLPLQAQWRIAEMRKAADAGTSRALHLRSDARRSSRPSGRSASVRSGR